MSIHKNVRVFPIVLGLMRFFWIYEVIALKENKDESQHEKIDEIVPCQVYIVKISK